MASKPGVTYICCEISAENEQICTVFHYNDGDLEKHTIDQDSTATFDFRGQVYDPTDPGPDYEQPLYLLKEKQERHIEGIFCEALLRPSTGSSTQPYAMFVRFMINPEAAGLFERGDTIQYLGIGFPVGWAVRGYLPAELARRNKELESEGKFNKWKNEMNMLPVFRADFQCLKAGDLGKPRGKVGSFQRMYYITNQEKYQLLMPKSIKAQVADARKAVAESEENLDDITKAKQKVLTRDRIAPAGDTN